MSRPIEDYALLSDCYSAALVHRDGSIDWLSFPAFDSPACFAALLGTNENGRWWIGPKGEHQIKRKYIEGTMVMETIFTTPHGSCKLIDCLLFEKGPATLLRTVEGITGEVELEMELIIRFDFGSIVPWVRRNESHHGIRAVGGPDGLVLYSPVLVEGKNMHTVGKLTVKASERFFFTLRWFPSHMEVPPPLKDPEECLRETISKWQQWAGTCAYRRFDAPGVKRSLLTLKALTYEPTGAIVAAPTTSLPESLGGIRNWDYRFAWIRDSSFALFALLKAGYHDEAHRWNKWLLRAVAGTPMQTNIMYGIRGERRLTETELEWLDGYENSRPVRIGNAAYAQRQLDIFGEVMSTSHLGRVNGIFTDDNSWRIQLNMMKYVCENWDKPDEGIWEVRGPQKHFTHSKIMAWVALKYAVDAVRSFGMKGEVERWEALQEQIKREVCERAFSPRLNSFTQAYDEEELDASVLSMWRVGFLPPEDPRMRGTLKAIRNNLMQDGLVLRYRSTSGVDGLSGEEGTFLACSFWMVDALRISGRREEALEMYCSLSSLRNDVGLFSEEYSTGQRRMVGNFPQALSHIAHAVSAMGFEEHHRIEEEQKTDKDIAH